MTTPARKAIAPIGRSQGDNRGCGITGAMRIAQKRRNCTANQIWPRARGDITRYPASEASPQYHRRRPERRCDGRRTTFLSPITYHLSPITYLRPYCDCNALAGFNRAARAAGIVVARNVIAAISKVALARINGSDARIAYTRLEMS